MEDKTMRESLSILCNNFIENRDTIKSTLGWENSYLYPVCAAIFTDKGKRACAQDLLHCRDILKSETGLFSNFRGMSKLAMISMMAVEENPKERLKNALDAYSSLKEFFWSSEYLPMVSMVIADLVEPERYGELAEKTKRIYKLMKNEHPFLTSGEDSVFAALLALSEMSDEKIVAETEKCYQLLKPEFFSGNAVQSLSHVLALCEGTAENKCYRTMQLFNGLKARGYKYGTDYELATLGVLAMLPVELEQVMTDIIAADDFLATQKGYGFLGIGRKQRMMHAGMLVVSDYMKDDKNYAMSSAAIGSVISSIVAQQTAMCAAVAASSAAAASSN